jgi:outer membrane receptor protein involved in Fe transport
MIHALLRNAIVRGLRECGLIGVAATSGCLACSALAQALPVPDTPEHGATAVPENANVTGSHIRRVDLETASPIVTIDRARIRNSGKLTLGDLVQELPEIAGAATNAQVNNGGGSGAATVSLRGLGSNRTLILIDGQRVRNPDINAIPANAVERIEVLKDGASSVYGSGAIAGVVNFIMRKDYQGARFQVDYGISDHGDGSRRGASLTLGHTTDRGSLVAGIHYDKQDAIPAAARDFSRDALYYYSLYGGVLPIESGFTPTGRIMLPSTPNDQGINLQELFGCASVTRTPGTHGTSLSDYRCVSADDTYNYQATAALLVPQERSNVFALGHYRLTDEVSAWFEFFGNKTSSAALIAPYPLSTFRNDIFISRDNLYNPFGLDFGTGADNPFNTDVLTRLTGLGQRISHSTRTGQQFMAGLQGNVGDSSWSWNADLDYGHESALGLTTGYLDVARLADALGPSIVDPATGQPICVSDVNDPSTVIEGCTPLNLFEQDDPASAAILRSAQSAPFTDSTAIQREASLHAEGELFDLPAGAVRVAIGALYRRSYLNFKVDSTIRRDPDSGSCALGTRCASPVSGSLDTREAYAEVFVPILRDLPFFRALNVDLGTRYSKFSLAANTTSSKLAVEWRPVEDLLLRGAVSGVFRAPSITELFRGRESNGPAFRDPCVGYIPGLSDPIHDAACGPPTGATDIPPGGSTFPDGQTSVVAEGAVPAGFAIKPEHGKRFDFGVMYDPGWLPGLSIRADYYRIHLLDIITGVGAQEVVDLCYDDPTSPFCPYIHRFPHGYLSHIIEPVANLGRIDTSGVDFGFDYRLPESGSGSFDIGLNATYVDTFQHSRGADAARLSNAGLYTPQFGNIPRWRALGTLDWSFGAFEVDWRTRYVGPVQIGSTDLSQGLSADGGVPGLVRHIGAITYHDLSFGWTLEPIDTRLEIGVDNVFDEQPPFFYQNVVDNANTDVRTYDTVGRFYWTRAIVKF